MGNVEGSQPVEVAEAIAERRALVARLRPIVARLLDDVAKAQRRRMPSPLGAAELGLIKAYDSALADVTTYEKARIASADLPKNTEDDADRVTFEVPDNGRAARAQGWKGPACPPE